jgi:predicted RNA-binding Zn-ribbon protein involved in translation (DUF1610 family)
MTGWYTASVVAKEQSSTERGTGTTDDDDLHCVACGHRITSRSYRIEMGGAHEHTFVNPGGVVHHIGCFIAAPGCVQIGEPQSAFSWFPGWSWQIVLCGRCRAHLGWIYRCPPDQFHGLIVAALR